MRLAAPVVAGRPLRALQAGDQALYCALYGCPDAMRHVGAPLTAPRARAAFDRVLAQLAAASPRAAYWVLPARVDPAASAAGVGLMALQAASGDIDRAEVGVLLPPQAQGGGVASAALAALADMAFTTSALQTLWARHAEGHAAAAALMRRVGFDAAPRDGGSECRWQLGRTQWARLRGIPMARVAAGD